MQMGSVRVLLLTLSACVVAGCAPAQLSDTHRTVSPLDRQIELDQQALERRLQQLQNQALSELRKLRAGRQASTGAAEPARDDEATSSTDAELLVFGGSKHDVFLGCLCDAHEPDSVFNMLGEHGSPLSPVSIRNKSASYGAKRGSLSACSSAAAQPPVVVAADGKSLGLLTVNHSLKRRITAPAFADWLTRMCGE